MNPTLLFDAIVTLGSSLSEREREGISIQVNKDAFLALASVIHLKSRVVTCQANHDKPGLRSPMIINGVTVHLND